MADGAVLVVGGTGFVAAYVIARLTKQGLRVRTTVRSAGQAWTVREQVAAAGADPSEVRVAVADPETDPATDDGWAAAFQDCRAVVWAPDPPALPHRGGWDAPERVSRLVAAAGDRSLVMALPRWAGREECWPGVTRLAYGDLLGPLLGPDLPPGLDAIGDLLERRAVGVPRRWLNVVDVRDLAELVHRALERPPDREQRTGGIVEVGSVPLALPEIGRLLRDELGQAAARVPWLSLPDPVVRTAARIRPKRWRPVLPELGGRRAFDTRSADDLLGHGWRPVEQTLLDTARSIVRLRPQQERANVPVWTPAARF